MAYARLGMARDNMRPEDVATIQRFLDGDFTAPAQRPWVGLTRDQLHKCVVDTGIHVFEGDIYKFVDMLEGILRKNNT